MSVVDEVFDELVRGGASERTVDLVLAAMDGGESLEAVVAGGKPARPEGSELVPEHAAPSVYLTEIAVTGFRGIGPESKISFDPGPGLTVVVGRNGPVRRSSSRVACHPRWRACRSPWR